MPLARQVEGVFPVRCAVNRLHLKVAYSLCNRDGRTFTFIHSLSTKLSSLGALYSIGASEGEFYIDGFVLLTFIEPARLALNELAQYKTPIWNSPSLAPMQ